MLFISDASILLNSITSKTLAIVKPLSIAAFSSLTISYIAASPSGKHPYLLYSALSVPISFALAYFRGLPVYASLSNLLAASTPLDSDVRAEGDSVETTSSVATPTQDSEDERPGLESSVYNITKSDLDEEEAVESVPKSSSEAANKFKKTAEPSPLTSEPVSTLVVDHVKKLIKYGRVISGVASTAFLIVTVGIYGDFQ